MRSRDRLVFMALVNDGARAVGISHLWGQGSLVDLFMSILVSVGLVGCLVSSSLRTSGMGNGIAVGMEDPTMSNARST